MGTKNLRPLLVSLSPTYGENMSSKVFNQLVGGLRQSQTIIDTQLQAMTDTPTQTVMNALVISHPLVVDCDRHTNIDRD